MRQDIQREAEQLRMLKLKQEKLQEDPRFIEKIAREDLGYAKPGETVFRFVDEEGSRNRGCDAALEMPGDA